jgi:Outer membrane protein beta-barrel domain
MKKLMFLLAFGLLGIQLAQAQSPATGGFGIRGGVNFFNFGGDDVSENNYTNRTGYHAGVYASIFASSRIAIEPGVYYSVKGTQNDDAVNSRAILEYVDVPLLLRMYVSDGFNLFAGPQVSFLTESKFESDFGGSTLSIDTNSIKDTDMGLVFGLGYNLPKGFNVQGSYDLGLTPIFESSDADVYNRGFKFSLGYTF